MTKIGIRYTKPRKLVFEALEHLSKPVSANEINDYLKNKIDLTSVYRTLSLLIKSEMVNVILFGEGKKRYELKNKNEHHHHLVCEKCGDVKDVEMKESSLLKSVEERSKFVIKKHNLEFFGLCPDCQ
ncbi:MAG: transcriptional repressor [Candidatus Roizmanbacteria bacterium]|nr:transcriptional repressor [Candidatus Roizmanbacteria bacterium]MCR4313102.1 transcriptional repressor [Candidatus Roizmanbacteria bacterium]